MRGVHGTQNGREAAMHILAVIAAIAEYVAATFLGHRKKVPKERIIIMRARIGDRIVRIMMRQVQALHVTEEGELQNTHPGEAAVRKELSHVGRLAAQILRHDQGISRYLAQTVNKLLARADLPASLLGRFGTCGNTEIGRKRAEMVDANAIKQRQRMP